MTCFWISSSVHFLKPSKNFIFAACWANCWEVWCIFSEMNVLYFMCIAYRLKSILHQLGLSIGIILEELGAFMYRISSTLYGGSGFRRNIDVCRPNCVVLHFRRLILIFLSNLIQSNYFFQGRVQTNKCSWTAAWCGRQYACGAEGSAEEQYFCGVCESKTGPHPAWDKAVPV
jgi:hypothetical protein